MNRWRGHLPPVLLVTAALACSGPSGADGSESGTATETTATGGTGTSAETGSADTTGDGDGDPGDGDGAPGDGDGEPGDETVIAFGPGTLIIPMDTDYQDMGMLEAFGLLYQLLLANVPVSWAIAEGKVYGGTDFTASAVDLRSGADVIDHGYRGGPFLVHPDDAALAMPVIEQWLDDNPDTNVHESTTPFEVYVARRLLHAPTIGIFADGNEDIARGYLLAAKIPDSAGNLDWPDDSPDLLDPDEVAGPTDVNHKDGALFGGGQERPIYCQFMSMHWGVNQAQANPEVVAEVGQYLQFSTHLFAECQAVNAFENHEFGHFLTPNGLEIAAQPNTYDYYRMDTPFGQLDGPFESVGGSEPAYTVPDGDAYLQSDTTIITEAGSPEGVVDVWMTGYRNGMCPASAKECPGAGKVSYLGGHAYDTKLPISQNPTTNGVRLFLNSLFEAPCAFD